MPTQEQLTRAETLQFELGLFHITGLPIRHYDADDEFVQPAKSSLGCRFYFSPGLKDFTLVMLVTLDGEVWLGEDSESLEKQQKMRELAPKLISGIPSSCIACIPDDLIIARIRNPYENFGGQYPPVPEIQEDHDSEKLLPDFLD